MSTLPAFLEPSHLDARGLVLSRRVDDGSVGSGLQWAARSTSHAVTCDYLVGRGFRVCSCAASQVAVR